MSAIVSKWLLEIKGVKRQIKDKFYTKNGMRVFTAIVLGISIYDIIYILGFCLDDENFGKKLAYTLIADWVSFVIVFVFYIILPLFHINFIGMGAIPMYSFLVLELELNIQIHDFEKISGL